MKTKMKFLIGFPFVILTIRLAFFLMIYQLGGGTYVRADKLQDSPEKYVEFGTAVLEKYPYVKEAVMNPESVLNSLPITMKICLNLVK